MSRVPCLLFFCLFGLLLIISGFFQAAGQNMPRTDNQAEWPAHDPNRPLPPVIDPGSGGPPVPAPQDAIVLFDGKDLSQWTNSKGEPSGWKIEGGFMEVVDKTGSILSKQKFGDCQLHVEWATPSKVEGQGQGRGNSGVYLMGLYEVQILDSYHNTTYADGMAAAIYGQHPPLVNACRPPGLWQTYDIIFSRPRFDADGKLKQPAFLTVFHNGIVVHNHVQLTGPTDTKDNKRLPYTKHPDRLAFFLQDHGNPVRFRNIWIRDLERK